LNRFEDALASYEQALGARPDDVVVLHNRGITLHELTRFEDAVASYELALAARPDYVEALNSRGIALYKLSSRTHWLASVGGSSRR
jgi:tetratricopeptide (TPR) repeat protein